LAALIFGCKFEQQSEGVSIAGNSVWAGAQLPYEPVGEEPL
jgi:hypothetical protein